MTEGKVGVFNGIKFSNPGTSEGRPVRATLSSQIPYEPGSFSPVPIDPVVVPPLTASNTVDTLAGKTIYDTDNPVPSPEWVPDILQLIREGEDKDVVEFHTDKVPATLPLHSGSTLKIVPLARKDSAELDKIVDGE